VPSCRNNKQQLHYLPGTSAGPTNEKDIALARQFFEGNSQGPGASLPFAMPHPLPYTEMARMGEMSRQPGLDLSDAWVRQQQLHRAAGDSKTEAAWATEFSKVPQQSLPGPSTQYASDPTL
jgi:peroxin-5